MKKIFIFIIILFSFYNCDLNENIALEKNKNELVVIIKNYFGSETNIGSGISIKDFNRLDYNTKKRNDTIVINIELYKKLYIKNNNTFNHIINAINDTLKIDVLNNKTNIYFSNRTLRKYDTIDLKRIYKINTKKEVLLLNKHKKKYLTFDTIVDRLILNKDLIVLDSINYRKLVRFSNKILVKKKKILTTLLSKKLISEPNYNYEVSMLNTNYLQTLFNYYKSTSDSFYKNLIIDFIETYNILKNDFINYSVINKFIKTIALNDKSIKTGSGISYDFKKAIEFLPIFFKGNNLRIFWEFCLFNMAEQRGNISELEKYFNLYKSKYSNTEFIEHFKRKYIIDLKTKNLNNGKVSLVDLKNNSLTLSDLIKKNKGKIIYVDFWASWCAPCIAMIPASKELTEDYKNKNVVFIYISIDENFEKWKKTSKEEKLSLLKGNLLATNYPNTQFYIDISLETIPRYLLYDKNGNLVHQNAPRPEGNEIRKLFDNYLKE